MLGEDTPGHYFRQGACEEQHDPFFALVNTWDSDSLGGESKLETVVTVFSFLTTLVLILIFQILCLTLTKVIWSEPAKIIIPQWK